MQRSRDRSIASNLQKQASQTFLHTRTNTFLQQISSPRSQIQISSQLTGEAPQSIIQLLQNREANHLANISSRSRLKAKKYLLQDTEERIFSEVIELLDQIDLLRANIINVREEIRELQVSYPDIDEQVKFHGYGQRITEQQCGDFEEENQELVRQIEEIETRQVNSLEEVLRIERQRYEELKVQLSENGSSKSIPDRIKDLKASIADLQSSRHNLVKTQYPQFDQLHLQNQELRQKTIANLKNNSTLSQREQQLEQYLESEENDRVQFMEELKEFKMSYNKLKSQNQMLREKLARREVVSSKENSNFENRGKAAFPKTLELESNLSKRQGKNKLSEYQSHIRMMQNLKG